MEETQKQKVKDFWNEASCGEDLYLKGDDERARFQNQMRERYRLEPELLDFAEFERFRDKKTLEIGVGLGSDHQMLAEAGALVSGIDLTERAIDHVRRRFSLFGLNSDLKVGDAENLPFPENSFDAVYSWGVIHHSPDTQKCVNEIYRVLKPGGMFKVMIYHKYSMVGYMLWLRYALFKLRPWRNLDWIYFNYLESPGTKAFSKKNARRMFSAFRELKITSVQGHGDLLTSKAGQRHEGFVLNVARTVYPRFIVRKFFKNHGLTLLIEGNK